MRDHQSETAELLSQVELELQHCDAADDQIGEHSAAMEAKIQAELKRRRQRPGETGNDPRAGAEYLRLLQMRRHARLVGGVANEARRRRGA